MAWRRGTSPGNRRIEPRFDDSAVEGTELRAERRDLGAKPKKKPRRKAKSKKPAPLWRALGWLFARIPRMAYWGVVLGLWGMIGILCIVGWYGAKLPSSANWQVPERAPNVRIVGNDGNLLLNRGVGGNALRLEDMSPWLPQAVIAIEDRRYHSHFGFDVIGFARAMSRNIVGGRLREGGSTITQQLAKNLFLTRERTIDRKIQELIIALWLETQYSKTEILELYLNRVYFGAGAHGVDAAARRYFGKPATAVNLQEAAMLAGLLKAPSAYSPARNLKKARARSRLVLAAMQREGYINDNDVSPDGAPVITTSYYRSGPEHFIADMVMKEAKALIGDITSDVTVETTISPYLMISAQGEVLASLDKHAKARKVSQAALVTLAPDGAIRALIGGRNYGKSQFNRAVDAKRQPGSAFKTFVWQTALERGHTPDSVFIDEPVRIGKWQPQNYDQKYRGAVTLSEAFARSLNTIAVKLVRESGSKRVVSTARNMGIDSKLVRNASIALGTSEVSLLELTAAYAPYANGGLRVAPYLIRSITGPDGKVLYKRGKRTASRAVDPRVLGQMNAMLNRVVTTGTGRAADIKTHFAGGKTGTSQDSRDAWFIGHTSHLVTGVWFGNDDNSPTAKLTGGSLPAQVWGRYMKAAHKGLPAHMLPGDDFLIAALQERLPVPTARPRRQGEPAMTLAERLGSRGETLVSEVTRKARKTILDLLFDR